MEFGLKGCEDLNYTSQTSRIHVFRILSEAMRTLAKYGGGSNIELRCTLTEFSIEVELTDNSKELVFGNSAPNESQLGLLNMQHRAKLIGATIRLDTMVNAGNGLLLTWPRKQIAREAPVEV